MFAAAAATILIWGGTPVATKVAVTGVDPLIVGILRTVLAALVTGPVVLFAGVARPKSRSQATLLAISALTGFVAFPVLFSLGLRYTSASHGALILAVVPVFTGLFAAALEREAPPGRWWTGAAIAVVGEVMLIAFRFGLDAAGASLFGDLVVLASCVVVAAGYVAGSRLTRTLGAWPTTLWGITIGGVVLAPALMFVPIEALWAAPKTASLLAIAYLALLSTVLAYVAWYWALAHGGIGRVSASQFALPVVGLALAVVILSEPVTLPLGVAAAFIVLGIAVAQRR